MKALSENMNNDLAAVNQRAEQSAAEQASMPDMSALTTITGTIHSMGMSKSKRQANLLAARMGVLSLPEDEKLSPEDLSATMIQRA